MRIVTLTTFLFAGFLFVTGVAAQNTRPRTDPPCPPTAKTPQQAGPRGAGVGAATGTGIGAANGTGIGAANGTGIGTAGPGLGRIGGTPETSELFVRRFIGVPTVSMVRASNQTGTPTGTGIGAATGTGVGTATTAPAETTAPVPVKVTRTYIKEMDGTCYYVTNDGAKAYVAAKKCELY